MVKLNEPVFVQVSDLAALGQNEIDLSNQTQVAQAKAALCDAEQMVAAWIGADTLIERPVVETTKFLTRFKNNIQIKDGPITTLNSVKVGDSVLDTDIVEIVDHWVVFRNDGLLFDRSSTIVIDFLAGYRIDQSTGLTTMPLNVQQAILKLAVNCFANPISDLTEERIGDYAYVRGRTEDESPVVPLPVQNLLRDVRRPTL